MILETFLILFESDSKDVKEGAKEAQNAQQKLEQQINATKKASGDLGQSFLRMAKEAVGAFAAVFAYSKIFGGIADAATYADGLNRTAKALGIATEELGAWGRAAEVSGGSTEAFAGTLKNLLGRMAQLDVSGKSQVKPFFDELGVSMTDAAGNMRSVMDILPDLADKFGEMSKQEAIGFGRKLGLDDGTIMLLQRGRRELDAVIAKQKELGVVTKEDAEIAAKYKDAWSDMTHVFRILFTRIAGDVLPAITWLVDKFTKFGIWAREHEGFLYGMFAALSTIVGVLAVKAAIAAGAFTILGAPIYIIIGAIAALGVVVGLVWDDIKKFGEGAPSVIGSIADAFVGAGRIISGVWEGVKNVIMSVWNAITGIVDKVKGAFNMFGGEMLLRVMSKGQGVIGGADSAPLGAQTSNSLAAGRSVSKQSTISVGEINVQTQATDADGIAGAIGNSMNTQMRQTVNNFDDGVAG